MQPPSKTLLVVYLTLLVACAGLAIFGAANREGTLGVVCLASGLVGAVVAAATLPIAWALSAQQNTASAERRAAPLAATERLLQQIHDNTMLSDNAKRVLFRDREMGMLRQAIEEDIGRGDYNAGLTLCDEMANIFGYREEAEAFRQRIQQAGQASYDAAVRNAMAGFDAILVTRDWATAHREAARIRRLYPTHHLVLEIDQRILAARDDHKRELQERFLEAAAREDVDGAMSLLRHLDRYLSREEAAQLGPTAQAVVVRHRERLSVQFKQAVNDHRWSEAAQIGDVIMAEYPNTKMADEVRSMIDVLRVRASQAAVMAQG